MDQPLRDRWLAHADEALSTARRRSGAARTVVIEEPTGAVSPFTDEGLDRAIENAAARLGVQLTDHEVIIRGHRERRH